jgi:phenylacetic acid degradation operon negative regulatory protein
MMNIRQTLVNETQRIKDARLVVMKARSLVFDLFGDHLRYRGGEIRLRALVMLLGCFDIPEPTVRVIAARLRKEGWLDARREGRQTIYRLTDAAWRLLDEGRERIFRRAGGPWDGQWTMVLYQVPETERGARDQVRKRLAWLGFGALAPSVWISPHERAAAVRAEFEQHPAARVDVFRIRSEGLESDRDMAGRAWDLPGLDRDYANLLAGYRPRLAGYRRGSLTGRQALLERMALINDYRHFPFRDPDLPPELLPEGWSGRDAHEVFLAAHGLLREPAEEFVDQVLIGLAEAS